MRQAIWFLRRVSLFQNGSIKRNEVVVGPGDKVFVIGCGNTAMDAARTALRMGAEEVSIVYHRTINEMKALRSEYDDAFAEGVKFLWESSVTEIEGGENGKLKSITLDTKGTEKKVDADWIILAVGNAPAARIVSSTEGINVDEKGYVLTRETPYGMTTRPGVFAGGDVTNRPATVVHAMQDAKMVAEGIAKYIDAIKLIERINADSPR